MLAAEMQKSSLKFEEKDSRSRTRDYMFATPFHKCSSLITTPNLPPDTEGRADSL